MLALCVFESDGGGGVVQATGSQNVCHKRSHGKGGKWRNEVARGAVDEEALIIK